MVDEELAKKVEGIGVINPIPRNVMKEYQKYIQERMM